MSGIDNRPLGDPEINEMKLTPSPNCCYCEKPHGKSSPLIFQSCDACQAEWDKQSVAGSNNLISVSCPRCDLLFSTDATPALRKLLERLT